MLPNDPREFERRLTAGDFDSAIHRIFTEADLDEDDAVTSQVFVPASQDATLKQILERGRRIGRSRLWVAREFPASRLYCGIVAGEGELRLTLVGPASAGNSQADMGATTRVNALFGFGSTLQFRCGAEVKGTLPELVLIAKPKVTRVEFDELIGFEKPKVAPATREKFNLVERSPAMALDFALPGEAAGPIEVELPVGTFDVVVDFASSKLEVSTERLEGEDGILIATVQFDGGLPIPVILELDEKDRQILRGTVPLPSAIKEGREKAAIVVVHEVTADELPSLSPAQAKLWLAVQDHISIPLHANREGFVFEIGDADLRFLEGIPSGLVTIRVTATDTEVGQ